MITEEFKEKLTSAMNKGGWGKENIKEVLPLIEDYIKQLPLHNVSQQSEQFFALLRYTMPDQFTDVALKNIVKSFIEQSK